MNAAIHSPWVAAFVCVDTLSPRARGAGVRDGTEPPSVDGGSVTGRAVPACEFDQWPWPWPWPASTSSAFFSTTRVSVVRTIAAMEDALRRAERVTLTGSMMP